MTTMNTPPVVSVQEWMTAWQEMLVEEKELMQAVTRWPHGGAG